MPGHPRRWPMRCPACGAATPAGAPRSGHRRRRREGTARRGSRAMGSPLRAREYRTLYPKSAPGATVARPWPRSHLPAPEERRTRPVAAPVPLDGTCGAKCRAGRPAGSTVHHRRARLCPGFAGDRGLEAMASRMPTRRTGSIAVADGGSRWPAKRGETHRQTPALPARKHGGRDESQPLPGNLVAPQTAPRPRGRSAQRRSRPDSRVRHIAGAAPLALTALAFDPSALADAFH